MKTVNFLEAINSGKRFRDINHMDKGVFYNDLNDSLCDITNEDTRSVYLSDFNDLLSAEYELEEKTITITESQFDEVFGNYKYSDLKYQFESLKKELGF